MMTPDKNIKGNLLKDKTGKGKKLMIQGVTESGQTFRPSDWAERVSCQLSTFERQRIHYSPLLQPIVYRGAKCVVLDERLKDSDPSLYEAIMQFIESNNLKVCPLDDA